MQPGTPLPGALRVVGLMSGTSVDAIDAAVCEFAPDPAGVEGGLVFRLLHFQETPYPEDVRERVMALFAPETSRIDALTEMTFELGEQFAAAALVAIRAAGLRASDIDLIASHGQTIYHQVAPGRRQATLQIAQPAVIAARTGVTTSGDLRAADMAAGGQGAPLVSFFDALFFQHPTRRRALQNIGGIGNVTFVTPDAPPYAFDTGPGNSLINAAVRYYSGGAHGFDEDGQMAHSAPVDEGLLAELLADPYYALPPPKSTGRELFGDQYAARVIEEAAGRGLAPASVVATLTALTARTIAAAYSRFGPAGGVDEVVVHGGGARNPTLLAMLAAALPPGVAVRQHDAFGVPAKAKEAVAFALMGYEGLHGRPGALPSCTGARYPAVLGAIAPGANYRTLLRRVAASLEETPWQQSRTLRLNP
jgi:anhydro-N-acetylmuramic acid kinase